MLHDHINLPLYFGFTHNLLNTTYSHSAHKAIITCVTWERSMCTSMQKCVCKASLCVTACCFHTSIIGCETERIVLRLCDNYMVFPHLIEVLMPESAPQRWQPAHGMISSPWSRHLMAITVAFVHIGSPSLSPGYSESLNATGLFSHCMPQPDTNSSPLSSRLV